MGCEIKPNVDLLLVVGKKLKESSPTGGLMVIYDHGRKKKSPEPKKREANHVAFLITIAKMLSPKFPS